MDSFFSTQKSFHELTCPFRRSCLPWRDSNLSKSGWVRRSIQSARWLEWQRSRLPRSPPRKTQYSLETGKFCSCSTGVCSTLTLASNATAASDLWTDWKTRTAAWPFQHVRTAGLLGVHLRWIEIHAWFPAQFPPKAASSICCHILDANKSSNPTNSWAARDHALGTAYKTFPFRSKSPSHTRKSPKTNQHLRLTTLIQFPCLKKLVICSPFDLELTFDTRAAMGGKKLLANFRCSDSSVRLVKDRTYGAHRLNGRSNMSWILGSMLTNGAEGASDSNPEQNATPDRAIFVCVRNNTNSNHATKRNLHVSQQ